ncbi:MAG TPA: aspartate 1-decarboxylase [Limnochordia bacterium]
MLRTVCKSKIHRARVTEADLHYVGSITIDRRLMEAAEIAPYERVQVVNIHNGARFETYTMPGPPKSGQICINGAAARLAMVGDLVIIISYALMTDDELARHAPKVVFVDAANRIERVAPAGPPGWGE